MLHKQKNISPRFEISRKELRGLASSHGIKRGRNASDTVKNLRAAGILP